MHKLVDIKVMTLLFAMCVALNTQMVH